MLQEIGRVRLSRHTKKQVTYIEETSNLPRFKIVDQFDELPLEICSDEKSQNYNQYYADRGYLNSGVQIDWFCSDTSDAII